MIAVTATTTAAMVHKRLFCMTLSCASLMLPSHYSQYFEIKQRTRPRLWTGRVVVR
jgi:hypothetical protein